ncbi:hypothetical protein [Nannocystis pusilla]|uniref:hypothetical protein n=1 Tax=Nannocystis pusilla TaxID=889268 RepID=UPI003B7A7841
MAGSTSASRAAPARPHCGRGGTVPAHVIAGRSPAGLLGRFARFGGTFPAHEIAGCFAFFGASPAHVIAGFFGTSPAHVIAGFFAFCGTSPAHVIAGCFAFCGAAPAGFVAGRSLASTRRAGLPRPCRPGSPAEAQP